MDEACLCFQHGMAVVKPAFSYGALWRLRTLIAPAAAVWLLVLMLLSSLSEGVGLLMLVPVLHLLQAGPVQGSPVGHAFAFVLQTVGMPVSVATLLALFVLLVALRSAVQYLREVRAARFQHELVDRLRHHCFSAVLRAEWRWIVGGRRSDHANLLLTDVSRIGVALHHVLGLAAAGVSMLVYLSVALALSWQVTVLAVAAGAVVFVLLSGQRTESLRLGQALGAANRAIQANVQESLAGMKLTKILGNESRHLEQFVAVMRDVRQQQLRFVASSSLARALFHVAGAVLLALFLFVGLLWWRTPVPELLTLVVVFARTIPLFSQMQQQAHHCMHAYPALHEVDALLRACHEAAEPEAGSDAPLALREGIVLDGIGLRYPGRDGWALQAVSAVFPARTTTAVIGPSGAGKSTLADVLMGLLPPDAGGMQVDGRALTAGERMRWRRSVAYVPQENFLFHDSIRRNLLWGRDDADEADLREALRRAAAEFVFDLPQGLDTPVGDGGVRLSGGERQRLALARALLKRPALLILDEATSALDVGNELRIREAIENLHGDLTVVIIGHRLATLEHADQVLRIEQGRVVAQGGWNEINRRFVDAPGR